MRRDGGREERRKHLARTRWRFSIRAEARQSLDPLTWFRIYFLLKTLPSPTPARVSARFRIILQITGRRHGQGGPQEDLDWKVYTLATQISVS